MRDEETGALATGISVTDMGKKTVANDLDNARIKFDNVFADRTTLLSRFARVVDKRAEEDGNGRVSGDSSSSGGGSSGGGGGGDGVVRDRDAVSRYHQVDPNQSMRIEVIGQRPVESNALSNRFARKIQKVYSLRWRLS